MPVTPKQAADDCLARAFAIRQQANNAGNAADDLARMALVMGVAALDTYMHALIRTCLQTASDQVPKALQGLKLDFKELTDLADATVQAQRTDRRSRPWVQVKNALHRALLSQTFQSYEGVGKAMAMAGLSNGWTNIAQQMGNDTSPADIKNRLNQIVKRRNQIVHEGDLRRLVRPRNIEYNQIDAAEVDDDLNWMQQLIDAIDQVV